MPFLSSRNLVSGMTKLEERKLDYSATHAMHWSLQLDDLVEKAKFKAEKHDRSVEGIIKSIRHQRKHQEAVNRKYVQLVSELDIKSDLK